LFFDDESSEPSVDDLPRNIVGAEDDIELFFEKIEVDVEGFEDASVPEAWRKAIGWDVVVEGDAGDW